MYILMGVINFPSYTRYWPTTLCYEPIASVMPMKQNELQQKYLHTVDNTFYNQYKKNKPFKIRWPWQITPRWVCKSLKEENLSIDDK